MSITHTMNWPRRLLTCLFVLGCGLYTLAEVDGRIVTSAAELAACVYGEKRTTVRFDITAKASCVRNSPQHGLGLSFMDATGHMVAYGQVTNRFVQPVAGDVVRLTGTTRNFHADRYSATLESITVLRHESPEPPIVLTADELLSGRFDQRFARIRGTVRDALPSETNRSWLFLTLDSGGETVYAAAPTDGKSSGPAIGSEIEMDGVCIKHDLSTRRYLGRLFKTPDLMSIRVLKAPSRDPFDAPDVMIAKTLRPTEINALGRCRADGHVLAVWDGNRALLRRDDGTLVGAEFATDDAPSFGDRIEAIGFAETDLYQINLSRARWRSVPGDRLMPPPCQPIAAKLLFPDAREKRSIHIEYHGHALSTRGKIRSLPGPGNDSAQIVIENDGYAIVADISAVPQVCEQLDIGSMVEIGGTCITETENWKPSVPFPQARENILVVRTSDDVRVLASPPWWTPLRLLIVICSLLILLVGTLVWNTSLRILADRRGRELSDANIARAEADMRVFERTRLAVELHDTIAQNLTAVGMEIETARSYENGPAEERNRHLEIADRTLNSCRLDLRNCLWDLRNQALEEEDLAKAIRTTLLPHIKGIELSLRFNVPRARLTDNTTLALLRIIRELVLNGIRHGHATHLWIAGSLENDTLLFSVRDDGIGFDPEDCPGVPQGHFGIQGIRERLRQLSGTLEIVSTPGRGTKATVSIQTPHVMEGKT